MKIVFKELCNTYAVKDQPGKFTPSLGKVFHFHNIINVYVEASKRRIHHWWVATTKKKKKRKTQQKTQDKKKRKEKRPTPKQNLRKRNKIYKSN